MHFVVTTAPFHVGGEEILVDDAAVYNRARLALVLLRAVSSDEMPSSIGDVAVAAWHWRLPVFVLGWVAMNASAPFEPVHRANNISKADEDVWSHSWTRQNIVCSLFGVKKQGVRNNTLID